VHRSPRPTNVEIRADDHALTEGHAGLELRAAQALDELHRLGALEEMPPSHKRATCQSAVEAALQRYGRIDALVSNAGYAIRGAVEEVDVDAVNRMFDVNVNGIVRMVRAVAPSMRHRGAGRIVNIGSIAGRLAGPADGTYSATEHAVLPVAGEQRRDDG
jgi:NADP-dependent 3-hydroxy acid dehydrogenase YdfG